MGGLLRTQWWLLSGHQGRGRVLRGGSRPIRLDPWGDRAFDLVGGIVMDNWSDRRHDCAVALRGWRSNSDVYLSLSIRSMSIKPPLQGANIDINFAMTRRRG